MLWAALIWVLLSAPPELVDPGVGGWGPTLPPGVDKVGHALVFAVQAHLLHRARRPDHRPGPSIARSVAVAVAYGAGTEIYQSFLPGRSAELADLAADAVGAGLWALPALVRLRAYRARGVSGRSAGGTVTLRTLAGPPDRRSEID